MRPSRRPIVIATRKSHLALAQANAVANALRKLHPTIEVKLLPMTSEGDEKLNHPLATGGGKGLFTRNIEKSLFDKRADLAVHSLKDLPVEPTAGLLLAAIPRRGDVCDALITRGDLTLDQLPQGAKVGTSSLRRAAQLLRYRGDLQIETIRGNIQTRLDKVKQKNEYDATLLAVAGLQRAGMGDHARLPLSVDLMLPAAGQAALAIQCRMNDHVTIRRCLPLNDSVTAAMVNAERSVVAKLEADCHSSIAALAELGEDNMTMRLRVRVMSKDGSQCIEIDQSARLKHEKRLTSDIVKQLKDQGAMALLHEG